jgi:hypothetical protein
LATASRCSYLYKNTKELVGHACLFTPDLTMQQGHKFISQLHKLCKQWATGQEMQLGHKLRFDIPFAFHFVLMILLI